MATFVESTGAVDSTITPKRYVNAALDTGHSDGDALATVVDLATGGANLTQATSTKRPLYKTSVFGSKPAYLFDGTDDQVAGVAGAAKTHGTVFLLFKPTSAVTTASSTAVPLGVTSAAGQGLGWNFGSSTGALTNEIAVWQAPNGLRSAWTQSGGSISAAVHILTARWNSGTTRYDIFLDGGSNLTNAVTGTPSQHSDTVLTLGATSQNTVFYGGHIGVAIVYAEVFTDAQKAAVHSYLKDQWGATATDYDSGWAGSTSAFNQGFFGAV